VFTWASHGCLGSVISPKHGLSMLFASHRIHERQDMNEPVWSSLYVARRVEAPAVAVTHALDRMLSVGPIEVDSGRAALTVGRGPAPAVGRGRLVVPGTFGRRVHVALEVEAWSAGACELALRPAGRWVPRDAERFGEAAALTLEEMRDAVVGTLAIRAAEEDRAALRRAS
jgi:hypothetical protein